MKTRFAMYSPIGVLVAVAMGTATAADNTPADISEQGPARLEEVTVTATRREERVEKVPISIDALSQTALREGALKTISDIATVSPGFQYAEPQNIPSTIQTLSIRGINSSTGQSPVGVYYGDTPLQIKLSGPTNFGSPMPVAFDLNRVEVARGPQGTLFGAGAEAGAVVLVPNSPDMAKYSGYVHAEEAVIDHGGVSYEVQGATGGPIVPDELGFRLAVYDRHDGGYVDRINPVTLQIVDRNSNTKDSLALRGALAFKVSDDIKVTPAILFQDLHRGDGGRYFDIFSSAANGQAAVGEFVNGRIIPERSIDTFVLPTLKVEAGLPFADFTGLGSYIVRHGHATLDQSSSPPAGCIVYDPSIPYDPRNPANSDHLCTWGNPLGTLYPTSLSQLNYTVYGQNLWGATAELRLASNQPGAWVTWVVGLFYDHLTQTDTEYQRDLGVDPTGGPILQANQTTVDRQLAEFANVDVHLTHELTATLGMRVAQLRADLHEYNGNTIQNTGEPAYWTVPTSKETPTTPRVSLSYQFNPNNLVYVSAAKGFRIGGGNSAVPSSCDVSNADIGTYKPDYLWSYEIGNKSTLFGGRLQLDSSAFHAIWSNIQQLNFLPCQFAYTFNAGKAEVNGFDLSVRAALTERTRVALNIGYSNAYFTQNVFASSGQQLVQDGDKVGPAPQVNAPWNISAWADYHFPLPNGDDLALRGEFKYKSHNPGPFVTQIPTSPNYFPLIVADPAIHVANARLDYTHGSIEVGTFVENVLNSHPVLQTFQESNAPGNNFSMSNTLQPRTVGVSIDYQF
jgi:outer membrane receptor protein involved in Fe transport